MIQDLRFFEKVKAFICGKVGVSYLFYNILSIKTVYIYKRNMNCPPLGFFKDSTSMLPKNQAAPCGEDGTNGSGLHFSLIGLAPGFLAPSGAKVRAAGFC